jgi:hypothetical protein
MIRQVLGFVVVCAVIAAAALVVLNIGDDGDETSTASSTSTTTTSTSTTTVPVTTTSIATACTGEAPPTTTAAPDPSGETTLAPFPTLNARSSVSTVGLDEVTFGLTVQQAQVAAATTMHPCSEPSRCYRVTPADAPEGISFVVHEGTIDRVASVSGPITPRSGAGSGSSAAKLVEHFGASLEQVPIDDVTTDWVFVPRDVKDSQFRVIFTTVNDEVESFRSGRIPMVEASDPCA